MSASDTPVRIKRIYAAVEKSDGARVLVDRLWPRGIKKTDAKLAAWLRELAPSDELRHWFHQQHDAAFSFPRFQRKYFQELSGAKASSALKELYAIIAAHSRVTLLFSSKEETYNNAAALRDLLLGMRKPPTSSGPGRAAGAGKRMRARVSRG